MEDKKSIRYLTKDVICFIVLACVISWPVMLLWHVEPNDPVATQKAFEKLSAPFALGPFFSAIIVTVLFHGRAGLRSLFKPLLKWRVGWMCFLFALTVPIAAQWLALIGWRLWTGMEWNLPSAAEAVRFWCTATPVIAIFIITEETGWRGFLLPRLQCFQNAFIAGLVVGAVWSFWHTPLWIAIELCVGYSASLLILNLLACFLFTIFFSVLMTWIFNSSGGSLLLMMLMHGSANASLFLVTQALNQNGMMDLPYKSFYALALFSIVSILLLRYGPQSLSKSEKATFSAQDKANP